MGREVVTLREPLSLCMGVACDSIDSTQTESEKPPAEISSDPSPFYINHIQHEKPAPRRSTRARSSEYSEEHPHEEANRRMPGDNDIVVSGLRVTPKRRDEQAGPVPQELEQ